MPPPAVPVWASEQVNVDSVAYAFSGRAPGALRIYTPHQVNGEPNPFLSLIAVFPELAHYAGNWYIWNNAYPGLTALYGGNTSYPVVNADGGFTATNYYIQDGVNPPNLYGTAAPGHWNDPTLSSTEAAAYFSEIDTLTNYPNGDPKKGAYSNAGWFGPGDTAFGHNTLKITNYSDRYLVAVSSYTNYYWPVTGLPDLAPVVAPGDLTNAQRYGIILRGDTGIWRVTAINGGVMSLTPYELPQHNIRETAVL